MFPGKKHNWAIRALVFLSGLAACIAFSGCAGIQIERLSGSEFIRRAEQMSRISSSNWTTYIGSSSRNAYLEFGQPAYFGDGIRTTIYWTTLAELPGDVATKLKAGTPPWKPWQSQPRKGNRIAE